ncbi:hypothetical protein [Neisseria dumasiana]|uniref:hypothetical protein n=1 Tax=Neisseria dumasiana TaxID=1931275 RepID=UPI00155832D1|nr:hypothetical protein [Neisseria dumasiana]
MSIHTETFAEPSNVDAVQGAAAQRVLHIIQISKQAGGAHAELRRRRKFRKGLIQ